MDPKIQQLTDRIRSRTQLPNRRVSDAVGLLPAPGGPDGRIARSTARFPEIDSPGASGDRNSPAGFVSPAAAAPARRTAVVVEAGQPFPPLGDGVVAAVRLRGEGDVVACVRNLAAEFGGRPRGRLVILDAGRSVSRFAPAEWEGVRGYGVSILDEGDPGLALFDLREVAAAG